MGQRQRCCTARVCGTWVHAAPHLPAWQALLQLRLEPVPLGVEKHNIRIVVVKDDVLLTVGACINSVSVTWGACGASLPPASGVKKVHSVQLLVSCAFILQVCLML